MGKSAIPSSVKRTPSENLMNRLTPNSSSSDFIERLKDGCVINKTKFTIEIPNNFDLHTLDYDLFIGLNIEASYGLAIDNDNLEMATIFYDSFSVVMDRHL